MLGDMRLDPPFDDDRDDHEIAKRKTPHLGTDGGDRQGIYRRTQAGCGLSEARGGDAGATRKAGFSRPDLVRSRSHGIRDADRPEGRFKTSYSSLEHYEGAERNELIEAIDASFRARLDGKDTNYTVGAMKVIREGLDKRKGSDEPWD
jgi:hypothetical protein